MLAYLIVIKLMNSLKILIFFYYSFCPWPHYFFLVLANFSIFYAFLSQFKVELLVGHDMAVLMASRR